MNLKSLSGDRVILFLLGIAGIMFEMVNFSTTYGTFLDWLGAMTIGFMSIPLLMALAICMVDLLGLVRLLGKDSKNIYVRIYWGVAMTINAGTTWYNTSLALRSHTPIGTAVFGDGLSIAVPIILALVVGGIRWALMHHLMHYSAAARSSSSPSRSTRTSSIPSISTRRGN